MAGLVECPSTSRVEIFSFIITLLLTNTSRIITDVDCRTTSRMIKIYHYTGTMVKLVYCHDTSRTVKVVDCNGTSRIVKLKITVILVEL